MIFRNFLGLFLTREFAVLAASALPAPAHAEVGAAALNAAINQDVMLKLGQCDIQNITFAEQVKALQAEVTAQRKRADDAEARLPKPTTAPGH